jgi:hypothetical protein
MPPLLTARVPELAPAVDIDLLNDYTILYQGGAVDLTRKVLLNELRSLMITGGPTVIQPAISGGTIIYIVPSTDAGTDTAIVPAAAGQSFQLRRTSLGMMIPPTFPDGTPNPDKEYDILSGGGFQLVKPGDLLIEDERFELVLFQLAPVVGPGTQTGLEFIKGKKNINANTSLVDVDMNKMIQLRAGATQITLTLPDIADVPVNSFLFIDTNINTSVENKIQTTGGQFIYMQNTNRTAIYIRPNERIQLYRDEDGWYVENNFGQIYDRIGTPQWVYKKGTNQIVADGSLVVIADYPRLKEIASGFGASFVSEALWQTVSVTLASGEVVPFPYRGCFADYDGTHIRVPDLRDTAVVGLKTIGGADPDRSVNSAGGFQGDAIKAPSAGTLYVKQRVAAGGDIEGYRAGHNAPGADNYDEQSFALAYPNGNPTNTKTRMPNIAFIPVINC